MRFDLVRKTDDDMVPVPPVSAPPSQAASEPIAITVEVSTGIRVVIDAAANLSLPTATLLALL